MSHVEIATLFLVALSLQTGLVTGGAIALWKSLLVHHPSWTGWLTDSNGRYMTSFRTLSIQTNDVGIGYVEFMSRHISMEMEVSSEDDRIVVFKETLTWNKTAHFEGRSSLVFRGVFTWDQLYYKFQGNISSAEESNFAQITFMPEGQPLPRHKKDESSKVGLYVGIPVVLAIIVISLGTMIMVWAFRKGYLRHVPFTYKSFRNSERSNSKRGNDMNMDKNQMPTPIVEQPAVHI